MRSLRSVLVAALAAMGVLTPSPSPRHLQVPVRIHYSHFGPEVFRFRAGDTVEFVIENHDPIDHEFILGDAAVQERHERGTEAHHGDVPGEISIPAKQTAKTIYVFRKAGTLVFACHLPGHFAYGMRGRVTVSP